MNTPIYTEWEYLLNFMHFTYSGKVNVVIGKSPKHLLGNDMFIIVISDYGELCRLFY